VLSRANLNITKLSPISSYSWAELALFSFDPDKPRKPPGKPRETPDKPRMLLDKPRKLPEKPRMLLDKPRKLPDKPRSSQVSLGAPR
jgi:hypothetical protein